MLKANELMKGIHFQTFAYQSMFNGALVIKTVSNYFSKSKKSVGRLTKLGML